jgi:hypothetical protein
VIEFGREVVVGGGPASYLFYDFGRWDGIGSADFGGFAADSARCGGCVGERVTRGFLKCVRWSHDSSKTNRSSMSGTSSVCWRPSPATLSSRRCWDMTYLDASLDEKLSTHAHTGAIGFATAKGGDETTERFHGSIVAPLILHEQRDLSRQRSQSLLSLHGVSIAISNMTD